mmetsp:Transcript_23667/g.58496  ORF Transcript_23667/g.58496 Transcript_23667/m.58496 type:complete len:206 (+) Transcript_23667:1352-1969(+)
MIEDSLIISVTQRKPLGGLRGPRRHLFFTWRKRALANIRHIKEIVAQHIEPNVHKPEHIETCEDDPRIGQTLLPLRFTLEIEHFLDGGPHSWLHSIHIPAICSKGRNVMPCRPAESSTPRLVETSDGSRIFVRMGMDECVKLTTTSIWAHYPGGECWVTDVLKHPHIRTRTARILLRVLGTRIRAWLGNAWRHAVQAKRDPATLG